MTKSDFSNKMNDIVIFRIIVILLLVLYHSFCFFRGSWPPPLGVVSHDMLFYKVLANFCYSFMLEGFTFISGFVYAYQVEKKGNFTLVNLVIKKTKRLIFPAIFWGSIYLLLFGEYSDYSVGVIFLKLLNGVHHFWFLPMLFFCFILYTIAKSITNTKIILLVSFFLVLPKNIYLVPSVTTYIFQYLYFFTLGSFIYEHRIYLRDKIFNLKWLLFFVSLYISLFLIYYLDFEINKTYLKLSRFFEARFFKTFGVLALYIAVNLFLKKRERLSDITYLFGSITMGIYIFHQMILDFLYYHTKIGMLLNAYILPIFAFIISIIVSIFLSLICKRIPILKKLI